MIQLQFDSPIEKLVKVKRETHTQKTMNVLIVLASFTMFWLLVAVFTWVVAYRFEEKEVIRCSAILVAFCCWLLWVVTYIMQINPLVGPKLNSHILFGMVAYWKK